MSTSPTTLANGLQIRSLVTTDGRLELSLAEVDTPAPGDHEVVLELSGRKVKQVVRIDAGITAQLVVPIPKK